MSAKNTYELMMAHRTMRAVQEQERLQRESMGLPPKPAPTGLWGRWRAWCNRTMDRMVGL